MKNRDIVEAITRSVVRRCGCGFSEDRIRGVIFRCFPSSPDAVTYRAELHGTLEATVPNLIEDITEWLSSGASIPVQLQLLTIDNSCSVTISSLNENECMATGTGTSGPSTGMGTNGPSTGTVVGIAIGVIGAIAVAIAIAIAVILFLCHKNRRATLKMTDTK